MTTLSIQPPFPLITDIDGQPLEDGYIWIGTANLPPIGNPIAVYWDAALTIPAALPVRTRGGYPVNAGTPARLYVGSDYSILVQNKNGSTLYSAPAATERYSDPVITGVSSADVSFLQAGLGAVVRTAQSKMRDTVSVKDFGAVGDGVADDTSAIQAAINEAAVSNKGVFFPAGTYLITGTLTAGTLAVFRGEGADKSILKKTTASSGHILDILGTTQKFDIEIADLTFDVNNIDSAIVAEYVTNFAVRRCKFKTMAIWGVHVGSQNGADSVIRNTRVVVEDCVFENGTQTYEHVLVYNSQDVTVRGCSFKTGANAIGIGVYQNLERILVENCYFEINIGLYYSISTNNITISNCDFVQCDAAIQGANESDNGAFGFSIVENLLISKCRFTGCNSPLQLGAVRGAVVKQNVFQENNEYGLIVNAGNSPVNAACSNLVIDGNIFADNNTSNVSSGNAPGVRFDAVGGSIKANISNNIFYDSRGTPRQLYPITFTNAFTWSDVSISGNVLNSYSGAESVGLISSAAFGSNVFLGGDNLSLSATVPSGISTNVLKRALSGNRVTVPYSASMTFDARDGSYFRIVADNSSNFTVNAPTNPTTGQRITVCIENASGGALGTVTWNAIFKLASWTQPANVFSRSIDFTYNGGDWVETSRTPADVPR